MRDSKIVEICLMIIAFAVLMFILRELQSIFIPLTFAVFLSFLFAPLNRFLLNHKFPVAINLIIMVVIILITFSLVGTVVYTSIQSFVREFPKYEQQLSELWTQIVIQSGIPLEEIDTVFSSQLFWMEIVDRLSLARVVSTTMGSFIDFIVKLLLTVFFMIFIVLARSKLYLRKHAELEESGTKPKPVLYDHIEPQVRRYLIIKTIISIFTGLLGMLIIWLLGIDFVIISGLLLFVLNYIPNFDSIMASIFPVLVCLAQYGISWRLFLVAGLLFALQMTIGNLVEPRVMGTGLKLSPIIILISLIFWYWVWGPIGMIVAVPLTAAISISIQDLDSFRVVSSIMKGAE